MTSYLGSGANAFGTEHARPKTSERSPPVVAAAHHKISQQAGRAAGNEETNGARTRRGRQSSYRATESGERERKGNGLHARSPPGAHDHFAERPSSRSKAGGGHWPLVIGHGAAGSQDIASRVAGPCCLRTQRSESRLALQAIRLCEREHSGRQHSVCLSGERPVCAGPRHDRDPVLPVGRPWCDRCVQASSKRPARLRKVASVKYLGTRSQTLSRVVKSQDADGCPSSTWHYCFTILVYAGSLGVDWGEKVGETQPYGVSNLSSPLVASGPSSPERQSKPSTWRMRLGALSEALE